MTYYKVETFLVMVVSVLAFIALFGWWKLFIGVLLIVSLFSVRVSLRWIGKQRY